MKLKIFTIFLATISFSTLGQVIEKKVKVLGIDSTESYYFIKGVISKPKEKILVISKKDTAVVCCEKIKIKNTYLLKLTNYLSEEKIKELPAKPPGTLKLREEEGYIIWDGTTRLPYKSPDIKSIYYLKENIQ